MKKPVKILLLAATLWPLAYICLFMIFTLQTFFVSEMEGKLPFEFFTIFVLHFLTIIWIWVLTAIYIINVFRNDRVEKDKKALWAVVLFLGNMIAMPIYWYLYIWQEPSKNKTIESAEPPC